MIYIFDIDGTIADLSHRLHFIQQSEKDWNSFFEACVNDTPIEDVLNIMDDLSFQGSGIILSTGRSNQVRAHTEKWLSKHSVDYDALYMRKEGDHRSDDIVKSELLDDILIDYSEMKINGIFEDRQQVVDMYRKRGFRVYQVAEGNF